MARARRILIVVHSYYVRDTRPRRIGTALAANGWEVDVVCARDGGEAPREEVDGVHIRRLPARRRRGSRFRYVFEYMSFTLLALAYVTAKHLRRRYDVVYVIGIPNFLVFAGLAPRLLGARVLLDMRDPLPEFFQSKYAFADDHPVTRLLRLEERLSSRFASSVVTVHDSMATLFERSVPRERIAVVANAPDPRLFDLPPASVQRDPEDRTMLYTGTLGAHYGIDLAIRALGRLAPEMPRLRLRIVAKNLGDFLPVLRGIARAERVEDRVVFNDPVPLDQVPAIVASAWAGVQPGRDDPLMRYSLSAKILEWARLGLPVIVGETAPLRELFGDEVLFHPAGDLEALCERIREAHADPEGLRARAARARATAGRLSYDEQVNALLAVLEGGERSSRRAM